MSPLRLTLFAALLFSTAWGQDHVPGRLLVKFNPGAHADQIRMAADAIGARTEREIAGIGVKVLRIRAATDERAALNALRGNKFVEFAEYDAIIHPTQVSPNDPWYANWQPQLRRINAPNAWTTTVGDPNLIVAVLDTGVEATHPDLVGRLVPGWNFYNNNGDTSDTIGHGTSVAGVIGAGSNNAQGVASVAWNVKIMPLRVTDSSANCTTSTMATAITYAADHGARVANASFSPLETSSTVCSAADYLYKKGGLLVVAAGNLGTTLSTADNPDMVEVSAIDGNDTIYSWSCTGKPIDVCAPGTSYTTVLNGGYGTFSGTSCAAPTTAGVVALIMSANPSLAPQAVVDVLRSTARDLGTAGWDPQYGTGCVDAGAAVAAVSTGGTADTTSPSVAITTPTNGATVSGSFAVNVAASDNKALGYVNLYVDGVAVGTVGAVTTSWTLDTTTMTNGTHTVGAVAGDASGNTSTAQITVNVQNTTPDIEAPTVTITNPTGGTIKGNVSVAVRALDNVGVVRVELYIDGKFWSSATASPFTNSVNTKKLSAGNHILQCFAYDAAGNRGSSQTVAVTR